MLFIAYSTSYNVLCVEMLHKIKLDQLFNVMVLRNKCYGYIPQHQTNIVMSTIVIINKFIIV